jgi:lipopolysaccharide/colanic/teichoic acid biosynthesis glycosyltransferase
VVGRFLSTKSEIEISDPYQPPPAPRSYETFKRAIDVIVAAIILVVFSPLWLLIGAAIRLSSEGPALFRRVMVGRGGRSFTYFKFRTMREGDDAHHREWLHAFVTRDAPYTGADFKVRDDPRVTRIGAILRRLSLDEVPQLLNVLRGEMSVVGPRPPIPFEFDLYDDRAKRRLAVKPGITGLYQITARSSVPFSAMLQIDLDYIERRSLGFDLSIMLRTPLVMLSGRGAG